MDKNSMCRLCLSSSEEFVCIFDEETSEILSEINDLLEPFQIVVNFYFHFSREKHFLTSFNPLLIRFFHITANQASCA